MRTNADHRTLHQNMKEKVKRKKYQIQMNHCFCHSKKKEIFFFRFFLHLMWFIYKKNIRQYNFSWFYRVSEIEIKMYFKYIY